MVTIKGVETFELKTRLVTFIAKRAKMYFHFNSISFNLVNYL